MKRPAAWQGVLHAVLPNPRGPALWDDTAPIRSDLFGVERLEHHAISLAAEQAIADRPVRVLNLSRRLRDNAAELLSAYQFSADALRRGETVAPAAEWLLDNYHLVELQLRQITQDLPAGYYRQLPKLASGPFAGYPRVFGIAWAYVAHTDSLVVGSVLARFVAAYQTVQPLTIGELWALAITLRIVLVENMRRIVVQITRAHALKGAADALVDSVMGAAERAPTPLHQAVAPYEAAPLPDFLAAQIGNRLRGFDPDTTPLLPWLHDRLQRQGTSLDAVVERVQHEQSAANVTMRNLVASMRVLSELDWAEFFESVSLVDALLRQTTDFDALDFATRNRYRDEIETLARHAPHDEIAITQALVSQTTTGASARERDPGHWLIGKNRQPFAASIGYTPPASLRLSRAVARVGLGGYLASLCVVTLALIALLLPLVAAGLSVWPLLGLGLLLLMPSAEAATALVNLLVTRLKAPQRLPALDLSESVPDDYRTLVAVPVILSGTTALTEIVERLEVHYLASAPGAVHYAILSDGPDSDAADMPADDALLTAARAAIAALNARYPNGAANRFLFLHRARKHNPGESRWMGWERKRGKLEELNRLLRGATDTSFLPSDAPVPQDIRYVITLDADTRLPRDTVHRLIGKMVHPLNRPVFDPALQRVTDGYGILQPRVTPALPMGAAGSMFQRLQSGNGGIDPYAAAVSDVYQDLFGEGSFAGKGIYDVDAFSAALAGRVPENTLLSHDLFEGVYARAALASDIEVIEDFPSRYDVAAKRQHRWVRGDWQLLPWITGRRGDGVPPLGRWKLIDNLRRSLTAPLTLLALVAGWALPLPVALVWSGLLLGLLAVPYVLPLLSTLIPVRRSQFSPLQLNAYGRDVLSAALNFGLSVLLLPYTAVLMMDAILRTLYRLGVSRRHLLEWVTAASAEGTPPPGTFGQYRLMLGGVVVSVTLVAAILAVNPPLWPLALTFLALWISAPAVVRRLSEPGATQVAEPLGAQDSLALRQIARRTWQFFETFVTPQEHYLPPDNFQETPRPVVAHRTSPTNIGLYLLSTVTARDMGWIAQSTALTRLEDTLATMQRMPRHRGHFYNWYDTRDLRVLTPPYVSSVDSGNLAGHLIAVAQSCRAWGEQPVTEDVLRDGLTDALGLQAAPVGGKTAAFAAALAAGSDADDLLSLADAMATDADDDTADLVAAIRQRLRDHIGDSTDLARLKRIETLCRRFAMEMDFAFLVDPEKKLLSIGYAADSNRLDPNCYDLLASEARLASMFAIAKRDVETRHWFRLGRTATPVGTDTALISWSGSMFEYLMPSLVMRAPAGSLLERTNRAIVARQQAYGKAKDIPWGISESAFNARDLEMTYQYSNFGVPGLGLKRGLSEDRVIAPYATGLASMVDPVGALHNYRALGALGAEGRYGFYEALDFSPSRLPAGAKVAIVRNYMAHHQGMTITAIANTVRDGLLRARFHADPMVQSVELLLQERVPRHAVAAPPRAEDVLVGPKTVETTPVLRRFDRPADTIPTAHLLSNGRYGVMLTPPGGGYSRWGTMAITRWRPETTQDAPGTFLYARDVGTGKTWSAAMRPLAQTSGTHSAVFCEHHAEFTHKDAGLTTTTEVVVSAEDDSEARRVTLTNTGHQAREIDLTSYAELVLAPQAADLAHPAFSKMFVVTDHFPELGAIIATRRPRSGNEASVWAAHIAVVEGEETAPMQYETDRARFIGRGRSMANPVMADAPLSGTTGTVLDPIFAIRRRVTVPAGGMARVTFWTIVAETPAALLDLLERHRDPSAFGRASTLAWTEAQVQLRHLGITHAQAADFQRLAGMILRNDSRLRPGSERIIAGAGPQSGLWAQGISGDLPIVLFLIDDAQDAGALREILAAHEYWRARQMAVDLVIVNDRSSSYVQDLQIMIEAAVRSAGTRPRASDTRADGTVHVLRSDLMMAPTRALLMAAARVVLVASRGSIGTQLGTLRRVAQQAAAEMAKPREKAATALRPALQPDGLDAPEQDLEFFNGTGGFAKDGREYTTLLRDGTNTPAPWINVIANPSFGFQVSAEGSGFTWSENSRENQLTPWSNDPVTDPAGEALYLRDLDSGEVWTPTAQPIRGPGTYTASHGFGYSRFSYARGGIASTLTQFVPLNDPVKVSRLTLTNTGQTPRRIAVTSYTEWVLGTSRSATLAHVTTERDPETGALMARNPWATAFAGRIAFADMGAQVTGYTADRASFFGHLGGRSAPMGLSKPLDGVVGAALDPCAVLQREVTIAPGHSVDVVVLLGQCETIEDARALIQRIRDSPVDAMLDAVTQHWTGLLGAVQVTTPDRAMDIMLNGWLLYQTLACRIWARAGFYQASGAYGFRDQLQDGMALSFSRPDMTREHLLRAAGRQFPEGDMQHWWLPHSGQGVRTRISDDRVWLGYGVSQYIAVTGDAAILDEVIPFIEGPDLAPGAHDDFFLPEKSDEAASLYEHCARALDQAIALTGENGMPLIGTGDWNDGMNRVGEAGKGTSVWLGWLLIATLRRMAPFAQARGDARAERWLEHATRVHEAIEREAWDGAWYRRGTFDDGTPLGSAESDECQIDSIAQSWSVLSGAGDPERAKTAMESVTTHLIRPDPGIALLFTPPFDRTPKDPGYIKGYPPGLRENGGQYTHAALWAILAFARQGNGAAAQSLFALLNPVNHARTPEEAARYKVEPYVIAADVYSTAPHAGRGGWTWYTGSAGWMYRAGIEGILGLTRHGDALMLDPCLPPDWPEVSLRVTLGAMVLTVVVRNTGGKGRGVSAAVLNGAALPVADGVLTLPVQPGSQDLVVTLG
ncbi:GH36-type glycosyl hydrolase domain-containing protein [Pararhodobacter zhoushanensis]|uniref:GH36-type glycosyl hydrolase domain-containing protein n=1 Tax=Pararhodobacter zhoushanensis TaxID=2479545 RepID=UPI001FE7DFAD|nr:glucoamylase family protein [Pararhodobacter zhoushanensis]